MRWLIPVVEARAVAERLPLTLQAYRMATGFALPAAEALLRYRLRRGKEHPQRIGERRGLSTQARPLGPLVWAHAASVGELISILPLIECIRRRDIGVLVTAGTVTAAEVAARRLPAGAIHQFVPLDMPQYAGRFLNHWKPDLALIVESELWPNLILASARRKIPLILINGRISENSFRRWRLAPRTIATLLGCFDLCLAQSTDDATRYSDLGAPRLLTTGNLKLDVPAPPADESRLWMMQTAVGVRPVIVAASTHPGEEEIVIDMHRRLKRAFPSLLTVVVPRHPDRGAAVAALVQAAGVPFALRSRGELPDRAIEIYVADTMGELGLFYRIAPIVFMGGSLVSHGGQNPIEPAKLGAAILHGPHISNFAEVYTALDAARAAVVVSNADQLVARTAAWLKDTEARGRAAQTGKRLMETLAGGLERTVAALDPYLMQFGLERQGGNA
jgi:3-deoxy-D-manno-octulosonic-acid transferase